MSKQFFRVKFDMFVDRPGVIAKIDRWKLRILSRTGAYGMGTMRKMIRPQLASKKARSVTVGGRAYFVPIIGKVLDAQTRRVVTSEQALEARKALQAQNRGRGAGSPPRRGPTDLLRKFIFFGVDPQTESTVVAPLVFSSQPSLAGAASVPELLNYGGSEIVGGDLVKYAPHPFVEPALDPTFRKMAQLIEANPVR